MTASYTQHMEEAQERNLAYVTDKKPGYTRKKSGKGFVYFDLKGKRITDRAAVLRIQKLRIPPAWQRVWICADARGHLQATGFDAKGRKQYRYHPDWIHAKQEKKFEKMADFAAALPTIRKRVQKDMELSALTREKVLATVVYLLEKTYIRIGNEEYKKENGSYGLTTIHNRHAKVKGNTVTFSFKGKSGVYHHVRITSKKAARVIARCQELPGQELFCYKNKDGVYSDVTSEDVNTYLKEITGQEITAKDFRTWGGTNLAAKLLDEIGCDERITEVKKNTVSVVKEVAKRLRNRPATCRKYYIHPSIIEAYEKGNSISTLNKTKFRTNRLLDEYENKVLYLLRQYPSA